MYLAVMRSGAGRVLVAVMRPAVAAIGASVCGSWSRGGTGNRGDVPCARHDRPSPLRGGKRHCTQPTRGYMVPRRTPGSAKRGRSRRVRSEWIWGDDPVSRMDAMGSVHRGLRRVPGSWRRRSLWRDPVMGSRCHSVSRRRRTRVDAFGPCLAAGGESFRARPLEWCAVCAVRLRGFARGGLPARTAGRGSWHALPKGGGQAILRRTVPTARPNRSKRQPLSTARDDCEGAGRRSRLLRRPQWFSRPTTCCNRPRTGARLHGYGRHRRQPARCERHETEFPRRRRDGERSARNRCRRAHRPL